VSALAVVVLAVLVLSLPGVVVVVVLDYLGKAPVVLADLPLAVKAVVAVVVVLLDKIIQDHLAAVADISVVEEQPGFRAQHSQEVVPAAARWHISIITLFLRAILIQ
jgi:hypothetical protein